MDSTTQKRIEHFQAQYPDRKIEARTTIKNDKLGKRRVMQIGYYYLFRSTLAGLEKIRFCVLHEESAPEVRLSFENIPEESLFEVVRLAMKCRYLAMVTNASDEDRDMIEIWQKFASSCVSARLWRDLLQIAYDEAQDRECAYTFVLEQMVFAVTGSRITEFGSFDL